MSLISAAPGIAGDDTVLAKAGDTRITVADLNRIIGYYTPEQQEAFKANPENKVKLLQKLIQERVLASDARRAGIDRDPGVREQLDIMTNNQLTSVFLKREVADKISVSDAEARIYYQLHKDDYKTPESVRVRHILVKADKGSNEDTLKATREKAESVLKRIRAGEDFATVAAEVSDDTGSKGKGGDLGFFTKGKMVPEFETAAFGLKPGEVSALVETKYGFHILKCEEIKTAGVMPFEEAKQGIMERVARDTKAARIKEYVDRRMEEEKTAIFPERLLK